MRCRYRVTVYVPIEEYEKAVEWVLLELSEHFWHSCTQVRVSKRKRLVIVNGLVVAEARSLEELKDRFWQNWRALKKSGMLHYL